MPIPVSVTHVKGKGIAAAQHTVATSGISLSMATVDANGGHTSSHQTAAVSDPNPNSTSTTPPTTTTTKDNPSQSTQSHSTIPAISTQSLNFWYTDIDGRPLAHRPPVVRDMTISLPQGSTCLLIGPNGAGKTTLLKVLGGKHMVPPGAVTVLGQPPFHSTNLTTSGALSYIGGNWERDVAFAGYSIPLAGDIPASQMLNSQPDTDPARLRRLIQVLDIDPEWRMHLVSDGQRRRVQIAMGLLRPFKVLLLDEITVDLDVLGRSELMSFLKEECEGRGATIVYATHIFDGLESWPSHIMYVAGGRVRAFERASAFEELQQGRLLRLVEKWLREEKKERDSERGSGTGGTDDGIIEWNDHTNGGGTGTGAGTGEAMEMPTWNNGWAGGRLTSSMKLSSNAVMRM